MQIGLSQFLGAQAKRGTTNSLILQEEEEGEEEEEEEERVDGARKSEQERSAPLCLRSPPTKHGRTTPGTRARGPGSPTSPQERLLCNAEEYESWTALLRKSHHGSLARWR